MLALTATLTLGLSIQLEPEAVISGEADTVTIRVLDAEDAMIRVEAGSVSTVARDNGTLVAVWRLPKELAPRRLAAGAFAHGSVVFATLAVSRRARFATATRPGARVRVLLDGEVVAGGESAEGRVVVNVLVPPGSNGQATVEHSLGDDLIRSEQTNLGTHNQIRLWGVHAGDDSFWFAYQDSGEPLERARLEAAAGDRALTVEAAGVNGWRATLPAGAAVEATVTAGSTRARHTMVVPVMPKLGGGHWTLAPVAGFTTDADTLFSPVPGLLVTYQPGWLPKRMRLVLDLLFAYASTSTPAQTEIQKTHFLLETGVGASVGWQPATDWQLETGLETGLLTTLTLHDRNRKTKTDGGAAWHLVGWGAIARRWGPGDVLLQVRILYTLTDPQLWNGRLLAVTALAGYRFHIGQ